MVQSLLCEDKEAILTLGLEIMNAKLIAIEVVVWIRCSYSDVGELIVEAAGSMSGLKSSGLEVKSQTEREGNNILPAMFSTMVGKI